MTDAELLDAARLAAERAYAPYSNYPVGAALLFADGGVVTGANVENASYGLSLCAETVAVARALGEGRRGGLQKVAVAGRGAAPATPCGRCRQVLHELAALDGGDPEVICAGRTQVVRARLADLIPAPFGPATLG